MQPPTLCVENRTLSVNNAVTTQSVGTISYQRFRGLFLPKALERGLPAKLLILAEGRGSWLADDGGWAVRPNSQVSLPLRARSSTSQLPRLTAEAHRPRSANESNIFTTAAQPIAASRCSYAPTGFHRV
jgi:hypothetical protein